MLLDALNWIIYVIIILLCGSWVFAFNLKLVSTSHVISMNSSFSSIVHQGVNNFAQHYSNRKTILSAEKKHFRLKADVEVNERTQILINFLPAESNIRWVAKEVE